MIKRSCIYGIILGTILAFLFPTTRADDLTNKNIDTLPPPTFITPQNKAPPPPIETNLWKDTWHKAERSIKNDRYLTDMAYSLFGLGLISSLFWILTGRNRK